MSSFFYFLFFLLFHSFPTSHIFSQSASLSNQHALTCTSISIPLLLSTPLLTNEYVYIKLPFAIGSLSVFTISTINFISELPQTLIVSSQMDPEFILKTPIDLPSNTWLNFTINFSDADSQIAGIHGCIQMKTLSALSNGLVYDENPCIGRYTWLYLWFYKIFNNRNSCFIRSYRLKRLHSISELCNYW